MVVLWRVPSWCFGRACRVRAGCEDTHYRVLHSVEADHDIAAMIVVADIALGRVEHRRAIVPAKVRGEGV